MILVPDDLRQAITSAVCEIVGPGEQSILPLPGGASLRRYYRVMVSGEHRSSVVVMELGDDRRPEEATKGSSSSVLPFIDVLHYLRRGGVAVPILYRYDEPRGLLYLEDLGDVTLEQCVQGGSYSVRRRYYQLAIDELIAMQRYTKSNPAWCIAFGRAFDEELLRWELDHFREWGLERGAGAVLTEGERRELDRQFDSIAQTLASAPRGFVHRDFQSRNLMVQDGPEGPRLRLIDFQDALLGTQAYDLVALLRDSYVELSTELLDELVVYYSEASGCDPIDFRRLFDLQTIQRKLKDAGRFVFIDRVKGNSTFLQYIPASHSYVAAALQRLPELNSIREIAGRYVPALG